MFVIRTLGKAVDDGLRVGPLEAEAQLAEGDFALLQKLLVRSGDLLHRVIGELDALHDTPFAGPVDADRQRSDDAGGGAVFTI